MRLWPKWPVSACVLAMMSCLAGGGSGAIPGGAICHDAEECGALHFEHGFIAGNTFAVLGCVVGGVLTCGEELHGTRVFPDVRRGGCIGANDNFVCRRGEVRPGSICDGAQSDFIY